MTDVDCDNADPNSYTILQDADCDDLLTEDDCDDNNPASTSVAADEDCDGYVTAEDCNDSEASINAGAQEICGDGVDQDCNGSDLNCFSDVTFTPCGQSGISGPSQAQCDSAYSGTSLEGLVNLANGMQLWTVPQTGSYQITAVGAGGGDATNYVSYAGRGTSMTGTFELTEGLVLQILVGQKGANGKR